MKTMKTKIQITVLMLAMASMMTFSGCAISTHYVQDGAKAYPPTSPDSVRIFAAEALIGKYDVIGSVAADCVGDGDDAAKLLREEAAKIGANAVIKTRLMKFNSLTSRTGIAGIAVRTSL
jgi:hypothetical protein